MTIPRLTTRARILLGAGALGAVLLAASTGGELSTRALRATSVVALLAAAAYGVRHAGAVPSGASRAPVAIRHRQSLGRECGVAIVEAGERRILIGFGPQGVTALAELAGEAEADPS